MEYLSIKQTAKRVPIGECTLREWVKQGIVPGYYGGAKQMWFYVDYEEFVKKLKDGFYATKK